MTEEINEQVNIILEGTEAVEPKPKRKRTTKPKEPKPFSLNDCNLSTDILGLWHSMVDKVSWPIGTAPAKVDDFQHIYKKALAYCAMFPINIADVKVSWFYDLQTMQEKPNEEFDAKLIELSKKYAAIDSAILVSKNAINKDKVAEIFKEDYGTIIANIESRIVSLRDYLTHYQREYATTFSKLEKECLCLENEKANSLKPAVCPPEFMDNEFFNLVKVDATHCYFVTKDILLIDPRRGGCSPINMGKFLIRINPKNFASNNVSIFPFINNIIVRGHWHPHINDDGGICWGNAFEPAAQGFTTRNYKQFFKVLYSLLSTYNAASPYVVMGDFYKKQASREITSLGARSYLNSVYYFGVLDYIKSVQVIANTGITTLSRHLESSSDISLFSQDETTSFSMKDLDYLNNELFLVSDELTIPEEFYEFDEANSKVTIKATKKEIIPFMKGDYLSCKLGKIIHNQATDSTFTPIETGLLFNFTKDNWEPLLKANASRTTTPHEILSKTKASLEGAKNETTTN